MSIILALRNATKSQLVKILEKISIVPYRNGVYSNACASTALQGKQLMAIALRNAIQIKCTGEHEHYACGSACQNTCSNPNGEIQCPIRNIRCNDLCYCDKGYVRNSSNKCIPVKSCPTN